MLTVEKVGKVDLPAPDIFFGNSKMEVTDTDIYKSDQVFTRGQMITVTGIDNLNGGLILTSLRNKVMGH